MHDDSSMDREDGDTGADRRWLCRRTGGAAAPERVPMLQDVQSSSVYVTMRDGVRIAVDVVLPKDLGAGEKLPALFRISRLGRGSVKGAISDEDRFWVEHGFARVLIDQRGTGASFGTSQFGPSELPDLYDVTDWIVKQPWSNGRVGAIGDSFEGTAADHLAASGPPAVRGVAPWFSGYNCYADLLRPGGLYGEWFHNLYAFVTQMDAGGSARRVDADRDGAWLAQAVAEHRSNPDLYSATRQAEFSDDALADTRLSLLDVSAIRVTRGGRKAPVPKLILASWYDAGTVQGTLERFRDDPGPQEVFIGAWNHGGSSTADPFVVPTVWQPGRQVQQRLEALAFFERHLKADRGGATGRRIHYYTIGAAQWHSTEVWPPKGLRRVDYFLSADRGLATQQLAGAVHGKLQTAATGDSNRWHTQLGGGPVSYTAAVKDMSALLSFTTQPLSGPLEITGQPILHVRLTCSEPDPSIIAYLIVIGPDGTPCYATEGHLRLIHRKLAPSELTLHSYA